MTIKKLAIQVESCFECPLYYHYRCLHEDVRDASGEGERVSTEEAAVIPEWCPLPDV